MKRVYVIAGHSVGSPGAVEHDGTLEYENTVELQRKVEDLLLFYPVETVVDDPRQSLSEVIDMINGTIRKGDLVLDIHFNNNNPSATGTEVFVHKYASADTREIATKMVNAISGTLGIPVRRYVKSRDYKFPHESARGKLAIVENVDVDGEIANVVLIEVCFQNISDMGKYEPRKDEVAEAIVKSLGLPTFIGDLDPKTEPRV